MGAGLPNSHNRGKQETITKKTTKTLWSLNIQGASAATKTQEVVLTKGLRISVLPTQNLLLFNYFLMSSDFHVFYCWMKEICMY